MKRKLLVLLMAILVVMAMMPTAAFGALGTGHQISVKIYKVVLDSSKPLGYQTPEWINTITVTCQDSTGHSGYNHSVELKEFHPDKVGASTTDWTGWQFEAYYSKGKDHQIFYNWTSDKVNATANVTGSEPYPCSKNFYLVYKDTTPPTPVKPDAPSNGDVENLLKNAVNIDCVNTAVSHDSKTYPLETGTYTIGAVAKNAAGEYTVDITVKAAEYVKKYNADENVSHELKTDKKAEKVITLKHNGKEWTIQSNVPVTFDVVCKETPALSDKDIIALEDAVIVDCTKQDTHPDKTYNLEQGSYLAGQVQGNKCTVSIYEADPYIAKYNIDVAGTHQLNNQKQDYMVELSYENGKWTVEKPAHIYVECEETSNEPEIDQDSIELLLLGKAVCVDCTTDTNHADRYYEYEGDFEYSNVRNGECIVTLKNVDENAYIEKYSKDVDKEHKKGTTASTFTVVLKYDTDTMRWTLKTPAHIYAECESGGGDEPIITPNGPTDEDVKDLLFGKIIVHCNTTTAHPDKHYGLLEGGYEIGGVEGNANTGYYVNIKVTAGAYIAEFSKDFGTHTQAAGDPAERNITLAYEDGAWTVSESANAIFYAECESGGGDEPIITPNGPTDEDVKDLLFGKIIVHCNTTTAHPDKHYGLLEGGYEIGGVEGNANTGYYVNIKVTAGAYIAEFSKDFGTHTQAAGDPAERNITLAYEDGAWTVSDNANVIFHAACQTGGGDNPSGGGSTGGGGTTPGGNTGGGTSPSGDDNNSGTVTPVAPTDPNEPAKPEEPAADPVDGNAGDDNQVDTHKVPKTGDNLPMALALYAFLAAGTALAMRKTAKKESK